jgi:hypothetical protein
VRRPEAVATSKERLLARQREGERAGITHQIAFFQQTERV